MSKKTPHQNNKSMNVTSVEANRRGGKKIIIGLLAAFVVLAVSATAYWYSRGQDVAQEPGLDVNESLVQKGYDATKQSLLEQAESTNDESQKSKLYADLALLALNNGNKQEAEQFAEQANKNQPSAAAYAAAAFAAEQAGNYAVAAEQFGKAAEASPDEGAGDTPRNYYLLKQKENQAKANE